MPLLRKILIASLAGVFMLTAGVSGASALAASHGKSETAQSRDDFCDDEYFCAYKKKSYKTSIFEEEDPIEGCANFGGVAYSVRNESNRGYYVYEGYSCKGAWKWIPAKTANPDTGPRRSVSRY